MTIGPLAMILAALITLRALDRYNAGLDRQRLFAAGITVSLTCSAIGLIINP